MAYGNGGRVLVHATVVNIKDNQILYPYCKQCYSKLQHEQYETEWICFKCSILYEKSKVEWRYRLYLTVADKNTLTDLVIFGKTLEPYFGTSADKFKRFLDRVDDNNLLEENMLLEALEQTFLGQSFIFGIKSEARLKELQKYHGHMSPVSASSVHKVKFGDYTTSYATQSDSKSDLVAVQILSSANVSFTGNTVLYNVQTLTDLNWQSEPLKHKDNKNVTVNNSSYLPYTTFVSSEDSCCINSGLCSTIEFSYEKSIEQCRVQNLSIDKSTDSLDVDNLREISHCLDPVEQKDIKTKNNHGFSGSRPYLSKKLHLETDFNNSSSLLNENSNQKQTEGNESSQKYDEKIACDHSQIKILGNDDENFTQNYKNSCHEKVTSDKSHLEILRNDEEVIKELFDQSYLEFSQWDPSFNASNHETYAGRSEKQLYKGKTTQSQATLLELPPPDNVEIFSTPTFSTALVDIPAYVPTFSQNLKDGLLLAEDNVSFCAVQSVSEAAESCDMPESEDLSKFLANDSFENEIMTEDFYNQNYDRLCKSVIVCNDTSDNKPNVVQGAAPTVDNTECDKYLASNGTIYSGDDSTFFEEWEEDVSELARGIDCISVDHSRVLLDQDTGQINLNFNTIYPSSNQDKSVDNEETYVLTGNTESSVCLFSDDESDTAPVSFEVQNTERQSLTDNMSKRFSSNCTLNVNLNQDDIKEESQSEKMTQTSHLSRLVSRCGVEVNKLIDCVSSGEEIELLRNMSCNFDRNNILSESLFSQTIAECDTDISELILDVDSKVLERNRILDKSLAKAIVKENQNISNDLDSDLEDAFFLAMDLCEVKPSEERHTYFNEMSKKCDIAVEHLVNESSDKDSDKFIDKVSDNVLKVQCDNSLNGSELPALSCSADNIGDPREFLDHGNTCNSVFNGNKTNPMSNSVLDVTEDGSMDLFDGSPSFIVPEVMNTSATKPTCAINNSVLEISEQFLDTNVSPCWRKQVKFARRLSTVRHLDLVDIRLNMCKTSSPLTNHSVLKSCLKNSNHDALVDQKCCPQSPIKCPGVREYNANIHSPQMTPVLNNSFHNSAFSPDLFSP